MPKLPRPSYGSVTATLALCAALGGTSYAAITVTGADVRNGSLTGKDINLYDFPVPHWNRASPCRNYR